MDPPKAKAKGSKGKDKGKGKGKDKGKAKGKDKNKTLEEEQDLPKKAPALEPAGFVSKRGPEPPSAKSRAGKRASGQSLCQSCFVNLSQL